MLTLLKLLMMPPKLRIAVLLILFMAGTYVQAKNWSLTECIEYAHQHNLQIKRQQLQLEVSKNNLRQSKLDLLPDANAGANQNFIYGRSIDPFTNDFNTENTISNDFYGRSSVTLFEGFRNHNRIKRNEYDLKASVQNIEKTKNDISLDIASAYLQILFNQELHEVARQQLSIIEMQAERTQKLVNFGNLAQGELLEIKAQIASEKLNVTQSKNQLDFSYISLTQLLDLDSVGAFDIEKPDSLRLMQSSHLASFQNIYNQSVKNLPRIRSLDLNVQVKEKEVEMAKGDLSPSLNLEGLYTTGYSNAREQVTDISLEEVTVGTTPSGEPVTTEQYQFEYGNYPFGEQLKDNAYKRVSLSLRIPVFNGWSAQNNLDNSKIALLDAKYRLEQEKQNLYKTIQQAHAEATAAYDKYESALEAVKSKEEAFSYAEQKFNVGLVNSMKYNIAKNNLIRANSDLLQAKYEYIFKIKILDFYAGKPLMIQAGT